jgi:hypothetical protein
MFSPVWPSLRRKKRPALGTCEESLLRLRRHFDDARVAGCSSLSQIAAFLNGRGLCTARGAPWDPSNVRRTLLRMGRLDQRLHASDLLSHDQLRDLVARANAAGCTSLRDIAGYFNARGIRAVRGGAWTPMQVSRLIGRVNAPRPPRGGGALHE